jgi:ankyrin repeat protein
MRKEHLNLKKYAVDEVKRKRENLVLLGKSASMSDLDKVISSIEEDVDVDLIESYDSNIWDIIAENDLRAVCSYLLDFGVRFYRYSAEMSPVMIAIQAGNIEIVRMFLTHGWDPNEWTDADNDTPLKMAAYNGFKDIFFLLIENGATLHLVGYDHEMTCDPHGERFEIGPEELLVDAIIGRNVEICNYLLKHIDINIWSTFIPRCLQNKETREFCLNSGIEALSSKFVSALDACEVRKNERKCS